MFEYLIVWRLDDEEYHVTECMTVKGNSIKDIMDTVARIEKDHTISSISNVSIH